MAAALRRIPGRLAFLLPALALAAVACNADQEKVTVPSAEVDFTGIPHGPVTEEQLLRGRLLSIQRDCGGCHGGADDPAAEGWLAGRLGEAALADFDGILPRNLTPDDETGLGRFSERQVFNSLRYGLRPSATPDMEITSQLPGEGNFPTEPDFLAPMMPWVHWRYMSDQELWDIAAYLKHGLKPVHREIPRADSPPDLWADTFRFEAIGPPVLPEFPTVHEELRHPDKRDQVLRGRRLVAVSACSGCHGEVFHPGQDGWLSGMKEGGFEFPIGPFKTRSRNITPHNTMGLGRFTERQIFNSLRYGLRPGDTADVEITSRIPGEGNFPMSPKYLAPPMPWFAWRHLSDQELWEIAAYLKHGVKPVANRVPDSEGPEDFWEDLVMNQRASFPAAPFPTVNERRPDPR